MTYGTTSRGKTYPKGKRSLGLARFHWGMCHLNADGDVRGLDAGGSKGNCFLIEASNTYKTRKRARVTRR